MSTVLSVKNVAKNFPRKDQLRFDIRSLFNGTQTSRYRSVLRDISFDLQSGDVLGIMGRNGCGKSTLLQIIAGIYAPDKGSVDLHGRISYLPAMSAGIDPHLTMRDNIYLSGILRGISRREINACFDEIIAMSELEEFLDTHVSHFSSGMSSRLAFAVTIIFTRIQKAEIILLDEVFAGGGDHSFKEKATKEFKDLFSGGTTVIFVSHKQSLIEQYCNRGLVFEKGEVLFDGSATDAVQSYNKLFT
jgi:ABC-2 type transport system ATP-binding protein